MVTMPATVSTCVAAALLAGILAGSPTGATASDDDGVPNGTIVVDESSGNDSWPDGLASAFGFEVPPTADVGNPADADNDADEPAESNIPSVPTAIVPAAEEDEPLETAPPSTGPPETDPPETIPPTTEPPVTIPPVDPPVEVPEPGGAQEPQPPTDGTGNRQIIITTPVDIVQAPVLLAETAADPIRGWGAALAAVLASLSIAMGAALLGSQRRGGARVAISAE